ncbi:MAG: hypothetical protein FWH41_07495 [Treponema sp.]|nr:hypothetical protein [Treponema sp.]
MTIKQPGFYDSPFLVKEMDNWHLKPDAPEDLKKEFEEYMSDFRHSNGHTDPEDKS